MQSVSCCRYAVLARLCDEDRWIDRAFVEALKIGRESLCDYLQIFREPGTAVPISRAVHGDADIEILDIPDG